MGLVLSIDIPAGAIPEFLPVRRQIHTVKVFHFMYFLNKRFLVLPKTCEIVRSSQRNKRRGSGPYASILKMNRLDRQLKFVDIFLYNINGRLDSEPVMEGGMNLLVAVIDRNGRNIMIRFRKFDFYMYGLYNLRL